MKTIIVFVLLLTSMCFSQNSHDKLFLSSGRIVLADSQKINAESITIRSDKVEYYIQGGTKRESRKLDKVLSIEQYNGNHAVTYAILGGLAFGAVGLVISLNNIEEQTVQQGPFLVTEKYINFLPFSLCALGGAILGFAIGSSDEEWEKVNFSGNILSDRLHLDIIENPYTNSVILSMKMSF